MAVGREKIVIFHVPIWFRRKAGMGPAYFLLGGKRIPKKGPIKTKKTPHEEKKDSKKASTW